MNRSTWPASLPPALDGLDPRWSRLITVSDADGVERTWHVLDTFTTADETSPVGTVLCVHGNPTWSYLWRRLLGTPPPGWRVVALDHLGMGYSDRPAAARSMAQRIDDLGRLSDALGIEGPVVTVAHDWGGVLSLGWALAHREQLAGIVLTNTAVHQPAGSPAPALIRLAGTAGLRQVICQWSPAFVWTAAALSRPPLSRPVRRGLRAPYRRASRRRAIADFVADIPLDDQHPSAPALAAVVAGLPALADVPALLLWGPRDPVFSDRYLNDVLSRFPSADVHRFPGASHLVIEDRPEIAGVIADWIHRLPVTAGAPGAADAQPGRHRSLPPAHRAHRALAAALVERRDDPAPAVIEPGHAPMSFSALNARVDAVAAGLARLGVRTGDRVALLVPPGVDLTTVVYACWQLGAVIVVADAGLGVRRLGDALRSAGAGFILGSTKGLAAARLLRLPGTRVLVGSARPHRALADVTLDDLAGDGSPPGDAPPPPPPGADCAVVFTSGATGPPKGVVYQVAQVAAQLELIAATYHLTPTDRLVAAFAPFALYGPALGIASSVPAMDVTAPATLTAAALADAVTAIDATVVFAAPAALRNVVATSATLTAEQRRALAGPRLVMSAGAPLPLALVREVAALLSGAQVHTPYGMTEALPVTDIDLDQLEQAGPGRGVCVGLPVADTEVWISPLDDVGLAPLPPQHVLDVAGEVCVRAAHVKQRYDRLFATEAASARDPGWHRTGDVGRLDDEGRLWIEGRLVDVISTAAGPVTPGPVEQAVEAADGVGRAAVVGVGPTGGQQVVAIVVPADAPITAPRRRVSTLTVAAPELAATVRAGAGQDLAAVLTTPALPVDIRHNSKIDHAGLARASAKLLAGSGSSRRHR